MLVGSLAGVTYIRYTVLTSPNRGETAVHCCDPAVSVLVMLVSRNSFSRSISLAVLLDYLYTRPVSVGQIYEIYDSAEDGLMQAHITQRVAM